MGAVLDSVLDTYHYINYDLSYSSGRDAFYTSSPWFVMFVIASYMYFVQNLGPKLMKNRPAFELDGIIKLYNIIQVLASLYIFKLSVEIVSHERYNWNCMPILTDSSEYAQQIVRGTKLFFWLKIFDLLDTVFFVLRKKFKQASFLHVYHHGGLVLGMWFALKYYPGGPALIFPVVNSFVHTVMYSYYFLTTISPEYKASLWWKKHLTQLQMFQFLLLTVYGIQLLIRYPCEFPYWLSLVCIIQVIFVSVLFVDFYIRTYMKKNVK